MSETFGQRLRRLRTEQGLSRAELAVKAGLGFNSVSNYERDAVWPTIFSASCIADVLGVSLDYLAGRTEHV